MTTINGNGNGRNGRNGKITTIGIGASGLSLILYLLYSIGAKLDNIYEHLITVETEQVIHEQKSEEIHEQVENNQDKIDHIIKMLYQK